MADVRAEPKLRADGERNRQRILDAAGTVFAEQGLDVSMRQIAVRAGVGEPTLRRRFSSRDELLAEVFHDKVAAYADAAETALADPDPEHGFTIFVEYVAGSQLADRGFADVLTMTFPSSIRFEGERRRAYDAFSALTARAQGAGALREDFVPEDLILLLMAHAGILSAAGDTAEKFSGRLIAFLLQAFAPRAAAPLPDPPSAAETYRALLRLHFQNPK